MIHLSGHETLAAVIVLIALIIGCLVFLGLSLRTHRRQVKTKAPVFPEPVEQSDAWLDDDVFMEPWTTRNARVNY